MIPLSNQKLKNYSSNDPLNNMPLKNKETVLSLLKLALRWCGIPSTAGGEAISFAAREVSISLIDGLL